MWLVACGVCAGGGAPYIVSTVLSEKNTPLSHSPAVFVSPAPRHSAVMYLYVWLLLLIAYVSELKTHAFPVTGPVGRNHIKYLSHRHCFSMSGSADTTSGELIYVLQTEFV